MVQQLFLGNIDSQWHCGDEDKDSSIGVLGTGWKRPRPHTPVAVVEPALHTHTGAACAC
jgi:hypothetical protein